MNEIEKYITKNKGLIIKYLKACSFKQVRTNKLFYNSKPENRLNLHFLEDEVDEDTETEDAPIGNEHIDKFIKEFAKEIEETFDLSVTQ